MFSEIGDVFQFFFRFCSPCPGYENGNLYFVRERGRPFVTELLVLSYGLREPLCYKILSTE